MSLLDWTITGAGTYSVITDGTSPGTNTSVLQVAGAKRFYATTAGNTLDSATIETYIKIGVTGLVTNHVVFRLHNNGVLDSSFGSGGSNSNSYGLFVTRDGSVSGKLTFELKKYVNPSVTSLAGPTLATVADASAWQKIRFSCITVSNDIYLRAELWNGSTYDVIIDIINADATLKAQTGPALIEFTDADSIYLDDTKVYSNAIP